MNVISLGDRVQVVAVVALLLGSGLLAFERPQATAIWVTAWGASQQGLGTTTVSNSTVRMIARVSTSGESVRIRLDNTFGASPLTIGTTYIGHRMRGAALTPSSNRQVFFDRRESVTIPVGGSVQSDPLQITVIARQDLAVSLYIPGAGARPSQHNSALVTSYMSAPDSGDMAADETSTSFGDTTTSMFWLKAIDVLSTTSTGTIVVFGDSITDGSCSTLDAHDRWQDWLAVRLDMGANTLGGTRITRAVVNEGIGGNTVTRDNLKPAPNSTPGVDRLERDVLSHAGVTDVILFMGTNDIRREATAAAVIAGMTEIVERVQLRGLKIYGVTIIPRHNRAALGTNTGWNASKTGIRNEVNDWIRTRAPFDGVFDFDRVVRDPDNPNLIYPPYDCDGIHPTARGYYEMGKAINLGLFAR